MAQHCPRYQLRFSAKSPIWGPQSPTLGWARTFRGKFSVCVEYPQKPLVWGIPGNSFWGPRFGDLGGLSGEHESGQSCHVGRVRTHIAYSLEKKHVKLGQANHVGDAGCRWVADQFTETLKMLPKACSRTALGGDRLLISAGTGRNLLLPMRVPNLGWPSTG